MQYKHEFLFRFLALTALLAVSCVFILSGCANAPALDVLLGSFGSEEPDAPSQTVSSADATSASADHLAPAADSSACRDVPSISD